jgi:hypothetical protein
LGAGQEEEEYAHPSTGFLEKKMKKGVLGRTFSFQYMDSI